jgi:hypothetical protein
MAFNDKVRDLGNPVKFTTNTKGTERRGVPSAIAEIGKTQTAGAVENPTRLNTTGSATRVLRNLGQKRKIKTKV